MIQDAPQFKLVTIEAPPAMIAALRGLNISGLEVSKAGSASGAAILDSTMSGEDIRQVFEIITLAITTTKAGLELIDAAVDLLQKIRPQRVSVSDDVTRRHSGQLTAASQREDVARVLGL